eukprot:c26987_g1_i1.p1 GENE.c26987_g1_i1~~c26987_g1_i1.p1  ORF type:complete len:217 (-),score=17.74 c26987_g1_i1:61-675(-)
MIVLTKNGLAFDLLNPVPQSAHPKNSNVKYDQPDPPSSNPPFLCTTESPTRSRDHLHGGLLLLQAASIHQTHTSHSQRPPGLESVFRSQNHLRPLRQSLSDLHGHSQNARSKARIHHCDFNHCSKAFYSVHDLVVHVRTHTGERPYKCSFPGCDKAFAQNGGLSRHNRTHTGDRPFACRYCGRKFSESCHRSRHESFSCKQRQD